MRGRCSTSRQTPAPFETMLEQDQLSLWLNGDRTENCRYQRRFRLTRSLHRPITAGNKTLMPALATMRAHGIVRHRALAPSHAIVNRYLTHRPERLVVERRHAQRRPQLFIELAQTLQVMRKRRQFLPVIGKQEFLVPRIPQTRELSLQHDRGQNRHLVLLVGPFSKFRPATVFFHAHHPARAAYL